MSLKEWVMQVDSWRKQYDVQTDFREAPNLTKTRISCYVCGKARRKMHRHHTGNDMMFARMLPDTFAANYVKFRREDYERLCSDHHKRAHHIYKPLMNEFWIELNKGGTKIITPEWCEDWRQRFRNRFYEWVRSYKPRQTKNDNRRRKKVRNNGPQSWRSYQEQRNHNLTNVKANRKKPASGLHDAD